MPRRCQRTRSECIWAAVEAGCSGLSGTCHQNMFLGDFFRTLLCHNLIFPNHLNISPFIFSLFTYPKNNNFLLFLSIFCFTTISKPTLLFGFFTYPSIFAKDCLLTLVKSRLALGSPGCSFVRLSPCQKWPNTKENGY